MNEEYIDHRSIAKWGDFRVFVADVNVLRYAGAIDSATADYMGIFLLTEAEFRFLVAILSEHYGNTATGHLWWSWTFDTQGISIPHFSRPEARSRR
jgi:hypothetical protein